MESVMREYMKNGGIFASALCGFLLGLSGQGFAFSGMGAGSSADPYQITTVDQLQEMSADLSAHYVLINDIDASATSGWNGGSGFSPVGSQDAPFRGTFDGHAHRIHGFFINRFGGFCSGLFGRIDSSAAVMNVKMENVSISETDRLGSLVGINNGRITCCSSTGSLTGGGSFGGLVGVNDGVMERCTSSVNVDGFNHLGGLAGVNGGIIRNCYATGSVSGNENPGGLVGINVNTIENSYATGNVYTSFGGFDPGYARGAGGLVGLNQVYTKPAIIRNCFATGNVNGASGAALGGLVGVNQNNPGINEPVITNCYFNHTAGNPAAGVGQNLSTLTPEITAIDNQESYFFDNANPPENVWDFTDVWTFKNGETGVSFPELKPCVPMVARLNLTSMCSDDSAHRRWRVTNPNSFGVMVTWVVVGTSQTGSYLAPAGVSYFLTVSVPGPNTTIISWYNEAHVQQQVVKASSGEICQPPVIKKLNLTSMCSDNPAFRRWRVTNPNTFAVIVTWVVVGTGQTGSYPAAPGYTYFFTQSIAGPNTTKIMWYNEAHVLQQVVKASSGALCRK